VEKIATFGFHIAFYSIEIVFLKFYSNIIDDFFGTGIVKRIINEEYIDVGLFSPLWGDSGAKNQDSVDMTVFGFDFFYDVFYSWMHIIIYTIKMAVRKEPPWGGALICIF